MGHSATRLLINTHRHSTSRIVSLCTPANNDTDAAAADAADFQFDPVKVEIERRRYLSPETIQPYITSDGIVNHFKLMWDMRERFPLHFIVFKQVSSHLPQEANVEQYFSHAATRCGSKLVVLLHSMYSCVYLLVRSPSRSFAHLARSFAHLTACFRTPTWAHITWASSLWWALTSRSSSHRSRQSRSATTPNFVAKVEQTSKSRRAECIVWPLRVLGRLLFAPWLSTHEYTHVLMSSW